MIFRKNEPSCLKNLGNINSVGIAYAKVGVNRYIFYTTNQRNIRRYEITTETDVHVAGGIDTADNGNPYPGKVDGIENNAKFLRILDLRYNPYDNYLYIGDDGGTYYGTTYTPSLRRMNIHTLQVTTVVSDVTIAGYATSAGTQCPFNITFDYSGNVYYGGQHYSYGVKKFDISTMTQSGYIAPGEFTPINENNYVFGIVWDNSWNGYLIHNHDLYFLIMIYLSLVIKFI